MKHEIWLEHPGGPVKLGEAEGETFEQAFRTWVATNRIVQPAPTEVRFGYGAGAGGYLGGGGGSLFALGVHSSEDAAARRFKVVQE